MPHLKTGFLPVTAYRPGFLGKKIDLTQFALKVRLRWKYKFHYRSLFFLTYQGNLTYTQKMTHALISLHFLNGFHTSSVHYAPGPRTFFCRGHFRLATSGRRPPRRRRRRRRQWTRPRDANAILKSQAALVSRFARSLYYSTLNATLLLCCFCDLSGESFVPSFFRSQQLVIGHPK